MAVQALNRIMSKKEPKPCILELFLAQTVATPFIYTRVGTVARVSTCTSCFTLAITDTKRIDKYCFLLAEKTSRGYPNAAFGCQKEKDLVFHCLRIAKVRVSTTDRMPNSSLERQPYDRV